MCIPHLVSYKIGCQGPTLPIITFQRLKHTPQTFASKFSCAQGHMTVAGTTSESHQYVWWLKQYPNQPATIQSNVIHDTLSCQALFHSLFSVTQHPRLSALSFEYQESGSPKLLNLTRKNQVFGGIFFRPVMPKAQGVFDLFPEFSLQ